MLGLDAFRRKPRQFEYKPLHYDPKQEARDKRRAELFGEQEDNVITGGEGEAPYIPGSYIRARGFSRKSTAIAPKFSSPNRSRNIIRGLIALLLLILLLVYILVTS